MLVKDMDVIADAKLVLARIERVQEPKRQRLAGLDIYYATLLERAYLPGPPEIFPNRCLTQALHADLVEIPDLRFTTLRAVGIYFGQKRFRDLGTVPWRTAWGNGWAFARLVTLRQAWELRQGGWQWPREQADWVWNPRPGSC
jgi:hypothetical protein